MTQSDIAEVVGVSQMQVSRLIARALDTLRARLPPILLDRFTLTRRGRRPRSPPDVIQVTD